MKSLIIVSIVALTGVLMSLQFSKNTTEIAETEVGINFEKGTWKDAVAHAKKENKIIFIDIYASWCGPCKRLKANTFTDENVAKFYNSKFVNITFDGEKGEGIELAKKYNVTAYPTLLFVQPDGSIVKSTMGYHNANQFLDLGKSVAK